MDLSRSQQRVTTTTGVKNSTKVFIVLLVSTGLLGAIFLSSAVINRGKSSVAINKISCAVVKNDKSLLKRQNFDKGKVRGISQKLTKDLSNFKNNKHPDLGRRIQGLAMERKESLIEAMKNDPELALTSILGAPHRQALNELTDGCAPVEVDVQGTLESFVIDMINEGESYTSYTLKTPSGDYDLHFARGLNSSDFISGSIIRIKGLALDDQILFDGTFSAAEPNGQFGGFEVIEVPQNPPVLSEQRTAVILAKFSDSVTPTLTREQAYDNVFNGVNNYHQENSFNKMYLTGDVYGWYTLPISGAEGGGCSSVVMQQAAINIADADIDYNNVDRLVIIYPFADAGCAGSRGFASGDKYIVNTPDGDVLMSSAYINSDYGHYVRTISHELGHNFGNMHARFLYCDGVTFKDTGCSVIEYGSSYDVMGNSPDTEAPHFNAVYKEQTGWFDPSNIQAVTTNGTYTLYPIEIDTTETQVLKIQGGIGEYLYLEYKQPIGYDAYLNEFPNASHDVFDGAIVHINYTYPGYQKSSYLLDTTPVAGEGFGWARRYPAIKVGDTFIDPFSGTAITAVAKEFGTLILDVVLGKTDFVPPTVQMIYPLAGEGSSPPTVSGIMTASANAFDESGIKKVEFYHQSVSGPVLLGTDFEAPYEVQLDTTQIPDGWNYMYAKAYDKSGEPYGVEGNSADSVFASFIVSNASSDTEPPMLIVEYPAEDQTVVNPVTFSYFVTDNVGIDRVEYFLNGSEIPYTFYNTPYDLTVNYPIGNNTVRMVAHDLNGNSTALTRNFFVVAENPEPTIDMSSPTDGSFIRDSILLEAVVDPGNQSIIEVKFYDDAGLIATGSLSESSWTANWSTSAVSDGVYNIYARTTLFVDDIFYDLDSSSVSVTVDNTYPTASLTSHSEGEEVSGTINLTASANDSSGLNRVDFYEGNNLIGTDATAPYALDWNTTSVVDGSYALKVKATDLAGNYFVSQIINVAVKNTAPDPVPTTITLTSPTDGQQVLKRSTVTMTTDVSGDNTISRVEFYVNGSVQCYDSTSPYSCNWSVPKGKSRSYTLQAKALESSGDLISSNAVQVVSTDSISDTLPPNVTLTAPADQASVTGTITISADATDDTAVARVEFYRDGSTLLGTDTTAPYSILWNSATTNNGSHTVTARAYDTSNNIALSASHAISVTNEAGSSDTESPTISITNPLNGSSITRRSTISIAASATDNVGVSLVRFYVNGNLVCSDSTPAYSCSWKVPGKNNASYNIYATAQDAAGNSTQSGSISVTAR